MIFEFRTTDGSIWAVDLIQSIWARISSPANDPLSEVLEKGAITKQGYGTYTLSPRTAKTEGPGAGLCSVGIMPVISGTEIDIYLAANVEVTDFTLPAGITRVNYKILPRVGQATPPPTQPAPAEPAAPAEPERVVNPFSPGDIEADGQYHK